MESDTREAISSLLVHIFCSVVPNFSQTHHNRYRIFKQHMYEIHVSSKFVLWIYICLSFQTFDSNADTFPYPQSKVAESTRHLLPILSSTRNCFRFLQFIQRPFLSFLQGRTE